MKKILLGSFVFTAIYNLLFYPTVAGVGIGLLFLFIHLYLFSVRNVKTKNASFAILLSVTSIIFASFIGFRANGVVQTFDLLAAVFLSIAAGYLYKQEKQFSSSAFAFIFIPFAALAHSINSIGNFFLIYKQNKSTSNHSQTYNAVLRGVIISIPIIGVLFLLLTGADPIFRTIFKNISFSISDQILVSIIVFVVCLVWGNTIIKDREENKVLTKMSESTLVIESIIVVLTSAALFAVFLFIQARFLFLRVPETELHKLGINIQTYSEYVRQGFFQLLFAASFVGIILSYILRYFHDMGTQYKPYLKFGMIALTFETELLLLSAGRRLYLYAEAHGLTRSRIFGIIFLFWLALILVIIFVSILKKIKANNFFRAMLAITVAAFLVTNIVPIDSIIANRFSPTINKEVDYMYVMSLSPEASSSWQPFIEKGDAVWKELSQKNNPTDEDMRKVYYWKYPLTLLNDNVYRLERKYGKNSSKYLASETNRVPINDKYLKSQQKWQAYNQSEFEAYQLIQQNSASFAKIKHLIESISAKEKEWYSQNSAL